MSSYVERLIWRWEKADREQSPETVPPPPVYRTPQSTIDAFWYVRWLGDPGYLENWLADHPYDREFLQTLKPKEPAE